MGVHKISIITKQYLQHISYTQHTESVLDPWPGPVVHETMWMSDRFIGLSPEPSPPPPPAQVPRARPQRGAPPPLVPPLPAARAALCRGGGAGLSLSAALTPPAL